MTDAAEAQLDRIQQEINRLNLALLSAHQRVQFNGLKHQMEQRKAVELLQIRDERIESDGNTIRHLTKENAAPTALNESYAAMLGFAHIPRFAS